MDMRTPLTLEAIGGHQIHKFQDVTAVGLAPPENRHGQSVRSWVRSLDGIQKEAVTLSPATGLAWRFGSDEGAHLNGRDYAPNPLSFVAVGMAGSIMTELLALAARRGVALHDPVLTLENFYYRDGSFPRGTMISGALPPVVSLACDSDAGAEEIRRLTVDAATASPINGLVKDAKPSLFRILHNGREITGGLPRLDGPALGDPGDPIQALKPADDADRAQPLSEKSGSEEEMRARIAEDPPAAPVLDGSKKLLHLRTTCRLRADGTYDCVREQYAQASSTWRFAVDDSAGGADPVAPDSLSYFATGVAFCFMTQIGRYAHMAKLPLTGYRVIQDMHFSAGGGSGGTGEAGFADPVETHVFMETEADDATAAKIVEVAERTCFLHALCRDRAKIRVRL